MPESQNVAVTNTIGENMLRQALHTSKNLRPKVFDAIHVQKCANGKTKDVKNVISCC